MKTLTQEQEQQLQSHEDSCRASFAPKTINEDERSVEITLSTDKPVRMGFWTDYDEVLPSQAARFQKTLTFLDSHNSSSVKNVIGSVREMRIDGDDIRGKVFFARDDDSEKAYQKVKDGHITDVSIGYRVSKMIRCDKGDAIVYRGKTYQSKDRELRVATDYQINEVSLVYRGANSDAKIRSEKDKLMPETTLPVEPKEELTTEPKPSVRSENVVDRSVVEKEVQERMLKRTQQIGDLCKRLDLDPMQYILSNSTFDEVRFQLLEKVANERKPSNVPVSIPHVEVGMERIQKVRQFVDHGLSIACDVQPDVEKIDDAKFLSPVSAARMLLEAQGVRSVSSMTNIEVIDAIRNSATGHTTSDFSNILANVLNKRLAKSYMETPTTYQHWVHIVDDVADFKQIQVNALGEFDTLAEVKEGDDMTEGTMSDKKEVYTPATYAKKFKITRQALINDDLRAFTAWPIKMGNAAARTVNKAVYSILTTNAALADGVELFHANHNNLGSAAALSYASIGAGKAAMRKQTGLGGNILNVVPKFLIVCAALEFTAEQLITSSVEPTDNKGHARNVHLSKFDLIVEPELDATSATAWFLASAWQQYEHIEVAFLRGQNRRPRLNRQQDFNSEAWEYSVALDFGTKAVEHRGIFKNAGA